MNILNLIRNIDFWTVILKIHNFQRKSHDFLLPASHRLPRPTGAARAVCQFPTHLQWRQVALGATDGEVFRKDLARIFRLSRARRANDTVPFSGLQQDTRRRSKRERSRAKAKVVLIYLFAGLSFFAGREILMSEGELNTWRGGKRSLFWDADPKDSKSH